MKRVFIALLLLSATIGIEAQHNHNRWSLIPRIGINSSKTTDNQYWAVFPETTEKEMAKVRDTDRKVGIVAGLDADYMFTKWLGGTLGVTYSNEGFKKYEITQDLNYLNISVLANIYTFKGLALKSGIQYGILLGAHNDEKYSEKIRTLVGYDLNNNKRDYRKENWSIPIAVSYEYKNIVLDLRYNIGIKNIYGYKVDDDYKTKSLWLTLGYRLKM
ncbi:MAG: PorT family protein [Prevotella sp.]|nr:PorT family protein [Prevotella sp.]